MTAGDRIVVALVAVLALASLPLATFASGPDDGVVVRAPRGVSRLGAEVERVVEVLGASGTLTVEVSAGRARVLRADCPDQVCVRSGWSGPGRPVVCAPNRVVLESGGGGGSLDAVSR